MKQKIRIVFYSAIYVFLIVAFFGISNGLGWEIEPNPQLIGFFVTFYIGGLIPLWKSGRDFKTDKKQVVDWDKEMERRKKMGKSKKESPKK